MPADDALLARDELVGEVLLTFDRLLPAYACAALEDARPFLARCVGGALEADGYGEAGRWIALVSAVVAGAVLAMVLIPHFGVWTAPGVLHHHHEH